MADQDTPTDQGENNNFDNDFEKLDPFQTDQQTAGMMDDHFDDKDLVTSSTAPEDDDYTARAAETGSAGVGLGLDSFQDESEEHMQREPSPSPQSDPFSLPDSTGTAGTAAVTAAATAAAVFDPLKESTPPAPEPVTVSEPEVSPKKKKPKGPSESWMKNIDPRVLDLIYWRDVKKTGLVFGSLLLVLLSLALFSVLSVVAYLWLAALTVTVSFVLYKKILGAVQKAGDGHPFKRYLEVEISLPEERVHQVADLIIDHLTCTTKELRRLFLVEDVIDSFKFGLLLWVLTYIGAWFNGMTLIILGLVAIFTLPKFYETYKVQIDQYLDIVKTKVTTIVQQVQEKLPFPKKKQA